jgi:hypothetical protein
MMGAFSIHDRITAWVDEQLAKEDPLGADEWGRHVTMALMSTPNGDAIVWVILITLRAPFLGLDAIGNTAKLQANIPAEAAVRSAVTRQVQGLRQEFIRRRGAGGIPQANGHRQGLPPGLLGKRVTP